MQIKCLDSLPLHVPRTYHDVGEFACGQVGRVMVSAVTTLEYFGYACMQLILLWHQLEVSPGLLVWSCCSEPIALLTRCDMFGHNQYTLLSPVMPIVVLQ